MFANSSVRSWWLSESHIKFSGAGLSADRRLIGDLSPCGKGSPALSRANLGRDLGGPRAENAEVTCPAHSRATGGEPTSRLFTHDSSRCVADSIQVVVSGSEA
jgi:hypothetical protein